MAKRKTKVKKEQNKKETIYERIRRLLKDDDKIVKINKRPRDFVILEINGKKVAVLGGELDKVQKRAIERVIKEMKREKDLKAFEKRWVELSSDKEVVNPRESVVWDLSKRAKHTYKPNNVRGIYEYIRRGRDKADLEGFDTPLKVNKAIMLSVLREALGREVDWKDKEIRKKVAEVEKLVKERKPTSRGAVRSPETALAWIDAVEDVFGKEVSKKFSDYVSEYVFKGLERRSRKKVNLKI